MPELAFGKRKGSQETFLKRLMTPRGFVNFVSCVFFFCCFGCTIGLILIGMLWNPEKSPPARTSALDDYKAAVETWNAIPQFELTTSIARVQFNNSYWSMTRSTTAQAQELSVAANSSAPSLTFRMFFQRTLGPYYPSSVDSSASVPVNVESDGVLLPSSFNVPLYEIKNQVPYSLSSLYIKGRFDVNHGTFSSTKKYYAVYSSPNLISLQFVVHFRDERDPMWVIKDHLGEGSLPDMVADFVAIRTVISILSWIFCGVIVLMILGNVASSIVVCLIRRRRRLAKSKTLGEDETNENDDVAVLDPQEFGPTQPEEIGSNNGNGPPPGVFEYGQQNFENIPPSTTGPNLHPNPHPHPTTGPQMMINPPSYVQSTLQGKSDEQPSTPVYVNPTQINAPAVERVDSDPNLQIDEISNTQDYNMPQSNSNLQNDEYAPVNLPPPDDNLYAEDANFGDLPPHDEYADEYQPEAFSDYQEYNNGFNDEGYGF